MVFDYSQSLRKEEWHVSDISLKDAKDFILKNHYSRGCSNTRVYTHGLFKKNQDGLYGVAMWLPPTKVAAQSVNNEEWTKVLSLTRLACSETAPKNAESFLLSQSVKMIKKEGRFVSLVTYADVRMGHTGVIYKASNWQYIGLMKGSPAWIDTATGRQVAKKATKSRTSQEMVDLGYTNIGTFGKHKYVLHLNKKRRIIYE